VPYDPHSYITSWELRAHVEYSAIGGMEKPLMREVLAQKVANVQQELDIVARTQQWHEILNDIHQQAVFLSLWGTHIPYAITAALTTSNHRKMHSPIP
jgi:nickel transport system substrate-binding protein